MSSYPSRRLAPVGLRVGSMLAVVLVLLAGCRRGEAPRPTPPPPTVTAVKIERRNVPIEVEAIGTTRAFNEVMIRARVAGFLSQKLFDDGSYVEAVPDEITQQLQTDLIKKIEAGTYDPKKDSARIEDQYHPLLVIDEAPFVTAVLAAMANRATAEAKHHQAKESKIVETAKAQLEVSEAQRLFAKIQYDRNESLYRRNTVTREELQERSAELQKAEADVQAKQASLSQAKVDFESDILASQAALQKVEADLKQATLDLGYCRMYAPISGRIGELQVKLGNYVAGAGEKSALVSIQQLDPMGVDFRPSSRFLSRVTEMVQNHLPVRLVDGNRIFPYEGTLVFSDNTVEPTTATFLLRASVPNPKQTMLPGVYLKTFTKIGEHVGALVVVDRAIIETQNGPTIFVVDNKNMVGRVEVEILDSYQNLRIVGGEKVKEGMLVIVDGLQLIRPAMQVKPEVKPLDAVLPKQVRTGIPTRAERLNSPFAQPLGKENEAPVGKEGKKELPPKASETPAGKTAVEAPAPKASEATTGKTAAEGAKSAPGTG